MKKIVKSFIVPIVVSVLCGFVCGKLVYSVYGDDVENKLSSSKIYLVENGKYLTYDNMREENNGNNYIYEVVTIEVLKPNQVSEMINNDYDLTLYTCTNDGQNRITVRCNKIKDLA